MFIRRLWTDKAVHPALVAGLGVVLLLLAGLQYRWIGEISEADRERLRNGLAVGSRQFRADFNREIAALALSFLSLPERSSYRARDAAADAYDRWNSAPGRQLKIRNVFIVEPGSTDVPPVMRLDGKTLEFETAEWPSRLPGINELRGDPFERRGGFGGSRGMPWFFSQAPGIALPLFARGREPRTREADARDRPRPPALLFLELDRRSLIDNLLPEIERRHFPDSVRQPYVVAVIEQGPAERGPTKEGTGESVIYSSRPGLSAQDFAAESRQPLLIGREEFAARLAGRSEPGRGGRERREGVRSQGSRGIDRPEPQTPGRRGRSSFRGPIFVADAPAGPVWTLAVRHRGGSLDAVVSKLRLRNLGISSGILLLLAAGTGLALISARRAEKLARLQMEFVAGVSHELRTPLAVILQAGDNLAEGVVSQPERVRDYGRLVRDEGRRLTNMVEQSLELAATQAGKHRYNVEPVSPNLLMDEALQTIRAEWSEGEVEVDLEVPADLPLVQADAAAVGNGLRNLIGNAVKYSAEPKWVRLEARHEGEHVVIRISDRGIGIAADDLPHIFDPFYRGRQALEGQVQGSGLGLHLAQEAAHAAGGDLTVESSLGRGSRFTLRLPTVPNTPTASPAET